MCRQLSCLLETRRFYKLILHLLQLFWHSHEFIVLVCRVTWFKESHFLQEAALNQLQPFDCFLQAF